MDAGWFTIVSLLILVQLLPLEVVFIVVVRALVADEGRGNPDTGPCAQTHSGATLEPGRTNTEKEVKYERHLLKHMLRNEQNSVGKCKNESKESYDVSLLSSIGE